MGIVDCDGVPDRANESAYANGCYRLLVESNHRG
jgi:hypothetical protein